MNSLILIGGGGHCASCIDVVEQEAKYRIAGIVEKDEIKSEKLLGYSYIGTDKMLDSLINKFKFAIITIGQIKNYTIREKMFCRLKELGANIPTIKSPYSYISKHSTFDEGTIILHDVIVNANVNIGKNCIINSKSLIEHDVIIGNHSHISTSVTVNGNVRIGDYVFIGSGSILYEGVKIPDKTIIKAGSIIKN